MLISIMCMLIFKISIQKRRETVHSYADPRNFVRFLRLILKMHMWYIPEHNRMWIGSTSIKLRRHR